YNTIDRATTRALLPLVAIGGGLAVTPAMALELGELTVQSSLGQPLRASIAYALAPNEMLSNSCVAVGGGRSTGGLPGIGKSAVSITDSAIVITGETVVREPMLGTRVTINCPYTPNLSREYMLFVDPATVAPVLAAPVAAPVVEATVQPAARTTTPRTTRTAPLDTTPIGQSTRYQVKAGETLGDIAGRIENRSMSLWPAVNAIFEANPGAFIDDDPNKLKAGSWLTIPGFAGSAPVVADTAAPAQVVDGSVYEPPILEEITESVAEKAAVESPVVEDAVATTSLRELRPGDVVMDSENPYAEPQSTVLIPDTELEGPTTTSESPNVPTATIATETSSEPGSMLAWFVGGGVAILGLLVLFGRRIRSRFGSTPVGAIAATAASFEQDVTDYDIDDDSPTEENLALDADLVLGTGLSQGTDMDIAQDFGFAATTELDIELPFEPEPTVSETDILPPLRDKMASILESEVLPEDDDYDMSVIMDATKMPQHEEVTERDLKAVEVVSDNETLISDDYTISKEVEYDILEQDYEDEMTATQALNLEIARAAADLKATLDGAEDPTAEIPLATVTEIDVTAEMPVQQEDDTIETALQTDPGDTAAVTINLAADDKTAEMPVANDDETAEMEISGGKLG
ncbi:MAG: hypothetical protein OEU60_07690, partial [Gammaproteobacteria bacterium]|nr:hypothetical protein [Gammaproteobacteria bacterium]